MKNEFMDCEISYIKCFSVCCEDQDVLRFRNSLLPDMYDHNFTYIKNYLDNPGMVERIQNEISIRKAENQNYCKILTDYPMDDTLPALFSPEPESGRLGIYKLCTNLYSSLEENENCHIKKIDNPKAVEDKIQFDLLLDKERLGEDFCRRRATAQCRAYLNNGGLDAYLCYQDGVPVGVCELFLHEGFAKIEDFNVLPQEQRKKYGTSILKHLIDLAHESKAQTIYLVTDEDDTVKDMYRKFGFEKADEMTELFFEL